MVLFKAISLRFHSSQIGALYWKDLCSKENRSRNEKELCLPRPCGSPAALAILHSPGQFRIWGPPRPPPAFQPHFLRGWWYCQWSDHIEIFLLLISLLAPIPTLQSNTLWKSFMNCRSKRLHIYLHFTGPKSPLQSLYFVCTHEPRDLRFLKLNSVIPISVCCDPIRCIQKCFRWLELQPWRRLNHWDEWGPRLAFLPGFIFALAAGNLRAKFHFKFYTLSAHSLF